MYNQQTSSTLPVSPREVASSFFLNGLPYSNPVVPNVNVYPEIMEKVPMVAGCVRKTLQDHAYRNELRTFLFNLCAQNNFNNETFNKLVANAAERAFMLAINGTPIEQAVQTAVEETCTFETAINVQRYPELNQWINNNQALVTSIPNTLNQYQAVVNQMQQFDGVTYPSWKQQQMQQQPFQQPYQQPNPQYPPNHMGHPTTHQQLAGQQWNNVQPQHGMSHAAPIPARNHGNFGVQGHQTTAFSTPLPSTTMQQGVTSGRKRGMQNAGVSKTPVVEEFGETDEVKSVPVPNLRTTAPEPAQEPIMNTHNPYQNRPRIKVGVLEGYVLSDDPERPYDHVVFDNGGEIKPAYISGWTPTFNPDKPLNEMYSLSKEVKFHFLHNGVVEEFIVALEEEMEYINHEIRNNMRRLKQEEGRPRIVPRWDLVEKLEPPKETTKEIDGEEIIEVEIPEAVVLPEVLVAHSLDEAEVKFHISMMKHGIDKTHDIPCEFYTKVVEPVYAEESSHIAYLKELSETRSLAKLADLMRERFEENNSAFWYGLDKRLTRVINRVLDKNLQLEDWSIGSFTDDYDELLTALHETFDEVMVAKMEAASDIVIRAACNVLSADESSDYYDSITKDDDSTGMTFDHFQKHVVSFADYCSVTYLPWNLTDLDVELSESPSLLTERVDPNLHAAVVSLIRRVSGMVGKFNHHYLMTKDHQLIEMVKGYHSKQAILLFTV